MRPYLRHSLVACLGFALSPAQAETGSPDEVFLEAYRSCENAARLEGAGNTRGALSAYQRTISLLDQITRESPQWKPAVVSYRRSMAAEGVTRIQGAAGKSPAPAKVPASQDDLIGELPGHAPTAIIPGTEGPVPKKKTEKSAKPAASAPVPGEQPGKDGNKLLENVQSHLKGLQDELSTTKGKLEKVTQEKEDLNKKYDKAVKDLADSAQKQLKLEQRAGALEDALMKAEKEGGQGSEMANQMRSEIESLRKQLRDVKIERDAEMELRQQLAASLSNVKGRVAGAYADRDAARKETSEFPGKIAAMQKQIDKVLGEKGDLTTKLGKVQDELAKMTTERDDARAQIAKMKEAQKQVDKLLADNTALMAKLSDAELQIKTFKAQGEEKDKQIAALKTEMVGVKQQLADAKKESANYQAQMASLQGKLEVQAKEIAQMKDDAKTSEKDRKRIAEENETLRNIVVRQMRQQAVRDKTKQLVLTELAKLDINSKALIGHVEMLGGPVVKLTEKERKLFKQPTIEIGDAEISIAAPKEVASAPPAPDTTEAATPPSEPSLAGPPAESTPPAANPSAKPPTDNPTKPAADAAKPAEAEKAPTKPAAEPEPKKIASKVPPEGELPMKAAEPAKPETAAAPPAGEKSSAPSVNIPTTVPTTPTTTPPPGATPPGTDTGAPAVPPELLSQAREAKEHFDKESFRDAERIYEKILQKAPNNLYILSNLGVVRFRMKKLKLAEESFRKAIAIAPEDSFARCTLGIVLYTQEKFDDALNELTKAVAIAPRNATAHNYLGITASQKGWQQAAQKELETAVVLDPQYADAHFNLAVVLATQEPPNLELARKHYKTSLELGAAPDGQLEQRLK
jgi:tetratricopeptide (TPR) repeat protein